MNSFRAVYRALEYEAERQREVLEAGGTLVQETRGWVEDKGNTVSQRSKEYAHDYRYFPEPDLPPLRLDRDWVESIRAQPPGAARRARRSASSPQYGLTEYEAHLLTETRPRRPSSRRASVAIWRGRRRKSSQQRAKGVSNWILGDFARLLTRPESDDRPGED